MMDEKLIHAAKHLVVLMDKQADVVLPKEIADVVKLHSKLAVGSAWIPIPGADVAAGAVNIWTMYGRINSKLGLKVQDNILKTIASGVATNLASYAAMIGVGSAFKFIPVLGPITGDLIMSASLYAITLVSGWVYLQALCKLAEREGANFNINQLGKAINDIIKDSDLKNFIKEAKKEYKK